MVSLIRPRSSFIGGSIPEWVLWVCGIIGAGSSGMGTSSASRNVDTTAWWNSNKSSPKKESWQSLFHRQGGFVSEGEREANANLNHIASN